MRSTSTRRYTVGHMRVNIEPFNIQWRLLKHRSLFFCMYHSCSTITGKYIFKVHSDERTPFYQKTLNQTYLPHVEKPVIKGHMWCRDTFFGLLRFSPEHRFSCAVLVNENHILCVRFLSNCTCYLRNQYWRHLNFNYMRGEVREY